MYQCNSEVNYRQIDSLSHKEKNISGHYKIPAIIFSSNLIFSKYSIDKQTLFNFLLYLLFDKR